VTDRRADRCLLDLYKNHPLAYICMFKMRFLLLDQGIVLLMDCPLSFVQSCGVRSLSGVVSIFNKRAI